MAMSVAAFNDPAQGWLVGEKLVLPMGAYTRGEDWLAHFESTFPNKAQKMREYSKTHGYTPSRHVDIWTSVCMKWLRENGTPRN